MATIERNIYFYGRQYRVEITRRRSSLKHYAKSFPTLEEARAHRDEIEAQYPPSKSGNPPGDCGTVALGATEYQRRRTKRLREAGICPDCSGENPEKKSRCRACMQVQTIKRKA